MLNYRSRRFELKLNLLSSTAAPNPAVAVCCVGETPPSSDGQAHDANASFFLLASPLTSPSFCSKTSSFRGAAKFFLLFISWINQSSFEYN